MKVLRVFEPQLAGGRPVAVAQDVGVPLAPGGVVHLGQYLFDLVAGRIEGEVQIQRAEVVAIPAELCEHANGTRRPVARALGAEFTHLRVEGLRIVEQPVAGAKRSQTVAAIAQQLAPPDELRQLLEVEIRHHHTVAKAVRYRIATVVGDGSFVQAAVHASNPIPNCFATLRALFTPSS